MACDILAQKYFRKAGVPACLKPVEEDGMPRWLWRRAADDRALPLLSAEDRYVGESSIKQVLDRLAGAWTYWGWKGGYFDAEADARAYYDEMRHMLCAQAAAPNSPQWFNTGLHWAYGIDGQPKAIITWTTAVESWWPRSQAMSTPSLMPASSRASTTTWSTRAASWTCGCARRACSSTGRAREPISRAYAAPTNPCRAAGGPRA